MLTNILQTTCWEVSITRHLPILSLQKKTFLELGFYTKIYNAFRNTYSFLKFLLLTILVLELSHCFSIFSLGYIIQYKQQYVKTCMSGIVIDQ